MSKFGVSRRGFIEGGLGLTVANFLPGSAQFLLFRFHLELSCQH